MVLSQSSESGRNFSSLLVSICIVGILCNKKVACRHQNSPFMLKNISLVCYACRLLKCFSTLEEKFRFFARPCNTLYIIYTRLTNLPKRTTNSITVVTCVFLIVSIRKDYEHHMLQSRLHFRIHSALQEIKHRRKQAKEASKMEKQLAKRSKNGVNNNTPSSENDSISISLEGSPSLTRQDSASSFETAPEYSSEDERDLDEMAPDHSPKGTFVKETTV